MSAGYKFLLPIGFFLLGSLIYLLGVQPELFDHRTLAAVFFPCVALALVAIPTEVAFFCYFFYVGVEGAAKLLSRYNPIIHVGADILVLLLLAKALTILALRRAEMPHRFPFAVKLFGAHLLWFVIVFANPYALSLEASLAAAKLYVTPVLLFAFGFALCDSGRRVEFFLWPWMIISTVHNTLGLYQGAVGPASVTSWSPMYGVVLERFKGYPFRPFGLTSNPGGPAVYSYFTAPIYVYFFLRGRSLLWTFFAPVAIAVLIVSLLLCQVKSAIIKFLATFPLLLFFVVLRRHSLPDSVRRRTIGFLAAIALIVVPAVPLVLNHLAESYSENKEAIERSMFAFDMKLMTKARTGAWQRFWDYAEMAPLGSGLSRIGPAVARFQDQIDANAYFKDVWFFADNFWVQVVVDLGLPGVVVITLLIVIALFSALKTTLRANDPSTYLASAAVFTGLVAIFSGSYGAEPVLYNPEAAFFWFFAGAMYRQAHPEFKMEGGVE